MKKINGNIVTHESTYFAELSFDTAITEIKKISDKVDPNSPYIIPGFIDLHIHGGGGIDCMDDADLSPILKTHLKFGTTSLLLTTVTSPFEDLKMTFEKIEIKKSSSKRNESKILGIHLEGPYISSSKMGAQPDFVRPFSIIEISELNNISKIKIVTVAPEHLGSEDINLLLKKDIIIQLGHSDASYEQACSAMKNGAKSITHLYNAMSPLHHRSPGMVGAAFAHSEYAEIIPDLIHVHPGAIKAALRAIPKVYFVTDATSSTGMPDGEYSLGKNRVTKCRNGVRLNDGSLAGSSLSMYQAFLNLINSELKLSINEASYRLSTIPAEMLGLQDSIGQIKEKATADLIVLNSKLEIEQIYLNGIQV